MLDRKLARAHNVPLYQCERNGRSALLRREEVVEDKCDVARHPDARALRDRIQQRRKCVDVSWVEGDRELGPVEQRCERRDLLDGMERKGMKR